MILQLAEAAQIIVAAFVVCWWVESGSEISRQDGEFTIVGCATSPTAAPGLSARKGRRPRSAFFQHPETPEMPAMIGGAISRGACHADNGSCLTNGRDQGSRSGTPGT